MQMTLIYFVIILLLLYMNVKHLAYILCTAWLNGLLQTNEPTYCKCTLYLLLLHWNSL